MTSLAQLFPFTYVTSDGTLLMVQRFVCPSAERLETDVSGLHNTLFDTILGRSWNRQYRFPGRETVNELDTSRPINPATGHAGNAQRGNETA